MKMKWRTKSCINDAASSLQCRIWTRPMHRQIIEIKDTPCEAHDWSRAITQPALRMEISLRDTLIGVGGPSWTPTASEVSAALSHHAGHEKALVGSKRSLLCSRRYCVRLGRALAVEIVRGRHRPIRAHSPKVTGGT